MKTKFTAYEPQVRPLGSTHGGGYVITLQVSEDQWPNIKEINDPINKEKLFKVILKGSIIK